MTGPLKWTLAEVARATRGTLHGPGDLTVTSVSTDSRRVGSDSLFVAVAGERFDGHDFVAEALAGGATGVVVMAGRAPVGLEPRVDVDDSAAALRDLGAFRRSELTIPVVAVTGSTGKTTTKDMLGQILPRSWASPASYNNEVGVPLTVLGTPADARYLVAEVGSRGVGDIAWLMPSLRPNVAVITNLGVVHLETFGTLERLARAKWEIVEGLVEGGTAVLPELEPRLTRTYPAEAVTFGDRRSADVWFDDARLDKNGRSTFVLGTHGERRTVHMGLAGQYQPWNAVAATAAALSLDLDIDVIVEGLEAAVGSPGRMEIHSGSRTIVNDAYNANPDSMEAAMRTVASMPGRHVAVVGLMAELGEAAGREHERIGALARDLGFAAVVVVGEEPGLAEAAGPIARRVADDEEAENVLRAFLRDGDVVLVKASHAVGLESLALRLVEEAKA